MINDFLDKTVDARFKHDSQGRLIFYPMGFGSGRIVPDSAVEASLRRGSRNLMIAIFVALIPALSIFHAIFQVRGWGVILFFLASLVLGFASQLYPLWLARGLARSTERLSYPKAMLGSLDGFSRKFLIFGLATSAILTLGAALMLGYQPARAEADPIAMIVSLVVFAPLTVVYAIALRRKSTPT